MNSLQIPDKIKDVRGEDLRDSLLRNSDGISYFLIRRKRIDLGENVTSR